MKLKLERVQRSPVCTIGSLTIDGAWQCWTLEDPVREVPGMPVEKWKVYGETAIPFGTYKVDITMSARFKRMLPILLDVPGFSGIRIHPGNTAVDTEGCLLPGEQRFAHSVGRSQLAFQALFVHLWGARQRREAISIEIPFIKGPT